MKLKKFEAASMKEALEKVKAEMGPDAFILSTKQISKKGPLGFGDRKFLQVTAAIEEDGTVPNPGVGPAAGTAGAQPKSAPLLDIKEDADQAWAEALKQPPSAGTSTYNAGGQPQESTPFTEGFEAVFAQARAEAEAPKTKRKSQDKEDGNKPLRQEIDEIKNMVSDLGMQKQDLSPLQKELAEMKNLLYNVIRGQTPILDRSTSPQLVNWFQRLKHSGIDEKVALSLIKMAESKLDEKILANGKKVGRFLEMAIKKSIEVVQMDHGAKRPRIVALVGPTGVGKTTTLCKLAAHAALQKGEKVALITLDTYRIAAVEQLKTYARIMELPVQVALNLSELRKAIQFHQDKDVILIDTAGHSQKDQAAMETLTDFLKGQPDIDVHLVLSATTKAADLNDIVEKFEKLAPGFLIFTKLDETSAYGPLFNQIIKTRKPVSYMTTGQNVPEDFQLATKDKLAAIFAGKPLAEVMGGNA